jgi:hypothetical protein
LTVVIKIVLVLFLSCFLLGCGPNAAKVAGRYVAAYGHGTDFVDLKADYSYVHYSTAQATIRQQTGTWRIKQERWEPRLILEDWVFYIAARDNERLGRKTGVSVPWDKDRLLFEPDFDEFNYYRQ